MNANNDYGIARRMPKRWLLRGLGLVLGLLVLGGCRADQREAPSSVAQDIAKASANPEKARMWMTVGERRFAVTLADTDTARAFTAQLPLTLDMFELNGNEKHAALSVALPADAGRPGTIHNGDLMLYGSNTVVVFYETFRSSHSYTRLGRVDDPSGLSEALGRRRARVLFKATADAAQTNQATCHAALSPPELRGSTRTCLGDRGGPRYSDTVVDRKLQACRELPVPQHDSYPRVPQQVPAE